jgi:hypothetical protein
MSDTVKSTSPEQKVPLKMEPAAATSLFKLTYRAGSKCEHKVFRFDGVLADAIVRSREHCTKMGIRFIHCEYFAVDLTAQEETKESFAKQVF